MARRLFVWAVVVGVSLVALYGLILSGSPGDERRRRLDDERVGDLRAISFAVDAFWREHARLPADLEELRRSRGIHLRRIEDPETAAPYEYVPGDADSYELCAAFATDSAEERRRRPVPTFGGDDEGFWEHAAGRVCFSIRVRKPASAN